MVEETRSETARPRWYHGKQKEKGTHFEAKVARHEKRSAYGAGLTKKMMIDDLSPDDVIIAVMGPTGAGKSSFIKAATGFDTVVGENLQSCTSEINIYKLTFLGISDNDIVFVDTPGFDDTNLSDAEILKKISDWLKRTYDKDILLSGILYLHRISDNRMAGTPLKNLRMFEKLCGKESLKNIILTTTMWDEVSEEEGGEREKELQSIFWKTMLAQGSITRRFLTQSREAAFEVLQPLLEEANSRHTLRIQREMSDLHLQLKQTGAGQKLSNDLDDIFRRYQETLNRIRLQIRQSEDDAEMLRSLMEEYESLKKKLAESCAELQKWKLTLGERLKKIMLSTFLVKVRRY